MRSFQILKWMAVGVAAAVAAKDYCACDSVQVVNTATRHDLGAVEIPVNGVSNCAAACNDAAGCTTFATFPGGTECDLFDGDFLGFVAATPAGQFTQAFLGTCASLPGISSVIERCTDISEPSSTGPSARARARSLKSQELAKRRIHGACDMC